MKLGYTLVYVNDVVKTIEFYEKAFGLKRGFVHESNQYGELETGSTKLGFVHHETAESHGFKYEKLSPKSTPPGIEIGLVSDDVQKSYDIALKAGANEVSKPTRKPWGQIVSYVRDCNGLLVEICSAM
jgi:lactoylglutathione lyase